MARRASFRVGREAVYCSERCRKHAHRERQRRKLAVAVSDRLSELDEGARIRLLAGLPESALADLARKLSRAS